MRSTECHSIYYRILSLNHHLYEDDVQLSHSFQPSSFDSYKTLLQHVPSADGRGSHKTESIFSSIDSNNKLLKYHSLNTS